MSRKRKNTSFPKEDKKFIYDDNFFKELYKKIDLKDENKQKKLKLSIIKAANTYANFDKSHNKQLSPTQAKNELKKLIAYLSKSEKSLSIISASFPHGGIITRALHTKIEQDYPSLSFIADEIVKKEGRFTTIRPQISIDFLQSLHDALGKTLKDFSKPKHPSKKSDAINWWLLSFFVSLEDALGQKLQQSHHYKNVGYISKRAALQHSELLLFILKPINPKATISQIETAIKETREERSIFNEDW